MQANCARLGNRAGRLFARESISEWPSPESVARGCPFCCLTPQSGLCSTAAGILRKIAGGFHASDAAGAALLAIALTGCVTAAPILPASEQSYVERVEVTVEKPVGTVNLAEEIRVKTLTEASRYRTTGRPLTLRVAVKDMTLKDPALSMLIGDANRMVARVAVVDNATKSTHGEFDVIVRDQAAFNGVVGAAISVMQNPVDVERDLASKLADQALAQVYGHDAALEAFNRAPTRVVTAKYARPYEELRNTKNAVDVLHDQSLRERPL